MLEMTADPGCTTIPHFDTGQYENVTLTYTSVLKYSKKRIF